MEPVRITTISFQHYKAFESFSISLEHINVLSGGNNAGKSTVIGALRALAVAIRSAKSRRPEPIRNGDECLAGYRISERVLPISIENVPTNYTDAGSRISFALSNGNSLHLRFHR